MYIGSAVNVINRWERHVNALNGKYHRNAHLQRSWLKYGEENFDFSILEIVENKNDLIPREQFYMDLYECYNHNKGYNIMESAGNFLGRKHSEETKKKLREINLGKKHLESTRRKMSKSQKGKVISAETRKKISEAHKGEKHWNYGKNTPECTKKKISESLKGEGNPMFGKEHSKETKYKISRVHWGKTLSDETKRKISEANSGEKNYFYGKTHTDESRRKISEANIGRISGEDNPHAKLTWDDVHEIRVLLEERKLKHREIAEKFNVSIHTIRGIKYGRTWRKDDD